MEDTSASAHDKEDNAIIMGQTSFDTEKLHLTIAGVATTLTYREGKLLTYLANNKNTIAKREELLAHVWEDEGIKVGRSLDVFISRLRKKLQPDPSIAIKTVHGVGYKLEA
jgi:DNA-binding response OmpR family regulator